MDVHGMKKRFTLLTHGRIENLEWLKINQCPMANVIPCKKWIKDETIVQWLKTERDIAF